MQIIGNKNIGYTILKWSITDLCNYSCCYCYYSSKNNHTNYKDIINYLDKLHAHNIIVRLYGGEPTLHPNFFEICDNLNTKFGIYTNLSRQMRFWEKVVSYKNLHHIYTSLHVSQIENIEEYIEKLCFLSKCDIILYLAVMIEDDVYMYDIPNKLKNININGYVIYKVLEDNHKLYDYKQVNLSFFKKYLIKNQDIVINGTPHTRFCSTGKLNMNTKNHICDINDYFIDMDLNGYIKDCPTSEISTHISNYNFKRNKQICKNGSCHIFLYEFGRKYKL